MAYSTSLPSSESELDVSTASGAVDLAGLDPQVTAMGKFLTIGGKTLWVRGVTYGTFRRVDGLDYPDPATVERDFAAMAAAGFNTVRTYTVPPRWLLDAASTHELRVMVGGPWEQPIASLADRRRMAAIAARVRAGVRACAMHPAVLCFALGNEIPAPIVRWHGRRRVERFLAQLADVARAEDSSALLTYVNYPTTEYLEVPWADLVTFNVYLEVAERLEAYLARLQNLAGDRPLVLGEIGLDSRRHGEAAPAPSSSPGPTSGIAAVTTSRTGTSGSRIARAAPSPRSPRSGRSCRRHRSRRRTPGRASPWSSAATTARGRSGSAWRAWRPWSIP